MPHPSSATFWDSVPVRESIPRLANATEEGMCLETRLATEQIDNCGAFVGEAYGIPTPVGLDAVHLTARTEGILLYPVYTGKAMAGASLAGRPAGPEGTSSQGTLRGQQMHQGLNAAGGGARARAGLLLPV